MRNEEAIFEVKWYKFIRAFKFLFDFDLALHRQSLLKFFLLNLPLMNSLRVKRAGLFQKRIPAGYLLVLVLIFSAAGYYLRQKKEYVPLSATAHASAEASPVVFYRMNGFKLTNPLLLTAGGEESKRLRGIKIDLTSFIQDKKNSGEINSASVFLKSLDDDEWTCINDDEVYVAGSLMKIPTLMTFLKESEFKRGLLEKKIFYDQVPGDMSIQTFNTGSIETGKSYTIKELLEYMITRSDNHATMLLDKNLSFTQLNSMFEDLDLPTVNYDSRFYFVTASQYSRFLQVLYDATYLSAANSSFAMELLTHSTFTTGIAAGVPKGTKVARKFGEAGSDIPGESQLHESGIVFLDDQPYLITVMTKGMNVQKLPEVIAEISRRVYNGMNSTGIPKPAAF